MCSIAAASLVNAHMLLLKDASSNCFTGSPGGPCMDTPYYRVLTGWMHAQCTSQRGMPWDCECQTLTVWNCVGNSCIMLKLASSAFALTASRRDTCNVGSSVLSSAWDAWCAMWVIQRGLPHLDVCQKGSNRLLMSSCRPGLIQPWLVCVCPLLQQLQHTHGCSVEGSPVMTRLAATPLCECHTSRNFALTHSRHAWSTTACCPSVPLLSTCMHRYQSRQQSKAKE